VTFLAAQRFWLLIPVVLLAALYVLSELRRRDYAMRFTDVSLLASVAPRRPQWFRRQVPAVLLILALTSLVVSLARPAHASKVPRERATVMLAIDVSNSMAATDVSPTRLVAAKEGAQAFIDQLPARINLGLVSFSGVATVQVEPTRDRQAVRQAINGLELGPSTAIGEGVFACLQAIKDSSARLRDAQGPPPARIVLISDGSTKTGRSNDEAARAAKAAKVPVDTIAYGTQDGTVVLPGQPIPIPVPVNEAALRQLADSTGGSYHRATSGDELRGVYKGLGSSIGFTTIHKEIDGWFTGIGLALGLVSAALGLWWRARLP
jgi:Ca-activated chloride channel family protein